MYGALVLHDSRISEKDNSIFFDLLEDYFNQPLDELQKDERPERPLDISAHSPVQSAGFSGA